MIQGVIFDFNRTLFDPITDKLTEGAITLLEKLKDKYKLALLSVAITKTEQERKQQIHDLGLEKYFCWIKVISKKTLNDFTECTQKMELDPKEVLVVGDRITSEITLGNQLNMTTVRFKSGKFSVEEPQNKLQEPNHVITRLDELLQYLPT